MAPVAIAIAITVAVLLILLAGTALAERPRFQVAVVTDTRESMDDKQVFPPDVAKVYIVYMLSDAPKGTRLKAVWYADHVEGMADNSKFNQVEATAAGGSYIGAFSYTKPTKGWPTGDYRVELYIEDRLEKTLKFKVVKR